MPHRRHAHRALVGRLLLLLVLLLAASGVGRATAPTAPTAPTAHPGLATTPTPSVVPVSHTPRVPYAHTGRQPGHAQAQRFILGATAASTSLLFQDNFTYPNSLDDSLSTHDTNWTYQGNPQVWARTNPGDDLGLGGNDASTPMSATNQIEAPGLPSVNFNQVGAGTTGIYQNTSASWASNPVAFSFRADMERGTGYTSTVLLTSDSYNSTTPLPSSPDKIPDYIGMFGLSDGKMHIRQSVHGVTTELAIVDYLFRSDEFRDWRLTLSPSGGFTVEQFNGMESMLTDTGAVTNTMGTSPSMWKTIYSGTGLTYGFTSAHLYAGITSDGSQNIERGHTLGKDGYYTGLDQVSEVNTSALPVPATPTISGINAQDNSAFVSFNPDMTDANIVGYSLAWWTPITWAQGAGNGSAPPSNRKNSTWAGQGVIQATGLVASQAYTYTVQAITTGGFYGPASAPVSATGQAFNATSLVGTPLNGYLDTFDGPACVQGFLDPTAYDTRWSFVTADSPLVCMSKHWMSSVLLGDQAQGLAPNAGLSVRTRAPFDFSSSALGNFGLLYDEFDLFDGARSWPGVHLIPAIYDSRQMDRDFQTSSNYPIPPVFLTLTHLSGHFELSWNDPVDGENRVASAPYQGVPDLRDHLLIKLSQNRFDLYVNTPVTGTPFFTVTGLHLPMTLVDVYQDHENYHTDIVGANQDSTPDRNEKHWGILGWTAPTGATAASTYQVFTPASCQTGFQPNELCDSQIASTSGTTDTYTLPTTATVAGSALYTFVGTNGNLALTPQYDTRTQVRLVVNGHAPLPVYLPYSQGSTDQNGFAVNVPISQLNNGAANTFQIQTTDGSNFTATRPQLVLSSAAHQPFVLAQTTYQAPPASSGIVAPWTDADIGTPVAPGYATQVGSTFVVTGSGSGSSGTADAGHYVSQPFTGNQQVTAQIASNTGSPGLMIRDAQTATGAMGALTLNGGNATFSVRSADGGTATSARLGGYASGTYLKLIASGGALGAYVSNDNYYWAQVGVTTSVALGSTPSIGLFDGGSGNSYSSATFTSVAVGAPTYTQPLPPNLLGNPGFESGSASPWTSYGNSGVSDVTHYPTHTGTYVYQTQLTGGGASQTITGLASNTRYNVSGWIQSQGSNNQGGEMYVIDSGGGTATSQVVTNTGAGFVYVSFSFFTGPSSTSASIHFESTGTNPSNGTGYSVEYDDAYMGIASPAQQAAGPATATYTPIPGSVTLYGSQTPISTSQTNASVGTRFTSSQVGSIVAIRLYRDSNELQASHVVALWDSVGNQLATATTANESAPGWYTATFATPVQITANTVYVASYTVNTNVAYTSGGFPLANAPLASASGANGVYGGSGAYPATASSTGNSYFVDPIFLAPTSATATPTTTPAPTVTPLPTNTPTALPTNTPTATNAAAPSSGTVAQASLTSLYNETDIVNNGTTFTSGGFDGTATYRSVYSSQDMAAKGYTPGGTGTFAGLTYSIPPAGVTSGISSTGQTITLNASSAGTTLGIMGAAGNGYQSSTLTITYADGSTDTGQSIAFPDWCSQGYNPIAPPIVRVTGTDGTNNSGSCSIYVDPIPLQNKAVKSITLPTNGNIHVLAVSVGNMNAYPTGIPIASAAITVSVANVLAPVSRVNLGINASVNDSSLTGNTSAPYINGANIGSLRYPGGQTGDAYHWATNSIDPSQSDYAAPNAGIDNFYTNVVSPTHSQANTFITINYATGSASEAAAWVQHNKNNGYGIVNYEIGNEQYFNHNNFVNPVNRYITQVISDVNAMRAVDPSIKVWVPFDVDHNFAMVSNGVSQWNGPVVSGLCSYIDGVDAHSYPQGPGSENDASLLANVPGYASGGASYIKSILTQSCPNKPLLFKIGEANSVSYNPGKQTSNLPNALFMADHELTWLENGATEYQAWSLRNGPQSGGNTAPSLYGGYLPGDYGVLGKVGSNPDGDNAPFPDAHALEMVGTAVGNGGSLVSTNSSTNMLGVHAVKRTDGSLALLIENRDPSNSYAVNVSLPGYIPAATGTTYSYGEGTHLGVQPGGVSTAAVAGLGGTFSQTVAPYSLTTLVMIPSGGVATPTPTPTPLPVATPTATLPPVPYPTVAALQTQVAAGQATVQAQATQIAYNNAHKGGKGSGPIHRGR